MNTFFQQSWNGLALGAVFALFSLGFSLVLANLQIFHVGHAAVFTWGAVFAWQFSTMWGWPAYLAFAVAIVMSAALNVLCYFLLFRPLKGRPDVGLAAFITSLGALAALNELASIRTGRVIVRLPLDAFPRKHWIVGGVQFSAIQLAMLGAALAVFLLMFWIVEATQLGREIRAVAHDEEMAAMLGVSVVRVNAIVFGLSGALAGIGAVLVALAFNTIDGTLGESYMLLAVTVVVIGGFGSVGGTLLGALMVGLISTYTTQYVSSQYRDVVIFCVLLLFLVVRPTGLFKAPDVAARV
jgi:branched-chain amino acid transport system permease protein